MYILHVFVYRYKARMARGGISHVFVYRYKARGDTVCYMYLYTDTKLNLLGV